MNIEEFKAAVKADEEKLARGEALQGMSTCADCKVPIRRSYTGEEFLADGTVLCSDCYWDRLGKHLDEHPIGVGRVRRFGPRS